jgi:hypothetical protein
LQQKGQQKIDSYKKQNQNQLMSENTRFNQQSEKLRDEYHQNIEEIHNRGEEQIALQKQKIEKQSRIVPAGHKMGLTYVSPDSITTHVKYLNKTTPVSIDSVTVEKRKTPKYKVVRKNHGYIRENGILRALIEVKKIPLGD